MENPFHKRDNTALIIGIIAGSVAAGAVAYLFLTDTGTEVRKKVSGHVDRIIGAITGRGNEEPAEQPVPDYLQHPQKRPKTDREKLLKHELISGDEHHGEPGAQPA